MHKEIWAVCSFKLISFPSFSVLMNLNTLLCEGALCRLNLFKEAGSSSSTIPRPEHFTDNPYMKMQRHVHSRWGFSCPMMVLELERTPMNHGHRMRMFLRRKHVFTHSFTHCTWLIFVFLHYLSHYMQRSTPMLDMQYPPLSCLHIMSHETFLAGNSRRPKVHTFFIWLIFPAAAWCLNKTNYSPSKGCFFCVPQIVKSKQVPVWFLFPLKRS